MPRGKRKSKEAPAPVPMNSAPGYAAPSGYAAPAPGSAQTAYTGSGNGTGVRYGAPPVRQAQEQYAPFISSQILWTYQRPVKAQIIGMRDATGTGKPEFQKAGRPPKTAWFLDLVLEDGKKYTGRINEGDVRHQRLWAAYGAKGPVNRNVLLRLTNPGDIDPMSGKPSSAAWMLEAL